MSISILVEIFLGNSRLSQPGFYTFSNKRIYPAAITRIGTTEPLNPCKMLFATVCIHKKATPIKNSMLPIIKTAFFILPSLLSLIFSLPAERSPAQYSLFLSLRRRSGGQAFLPMAKTGFARLRSRVPRGCGAVPHDLYIVQNVCPSTSEQTASSSQPFLSAAAAIFSRKTGTIKTSLA